MKTFAAAFMVLTLLAAGPAGRAAAVEPSEWHSEQPVTAGIEAPVLLGEIGDVACWAANRCTLITAGSGSVPAGIYAYDGASWYRYSTVCGGHNGRIAWTGPDEFWTVSDQRAGEEVHVGDAQRLENRSLCLFRNGEVVASYAEPLDQVGSYFRVNAATCEGSDDCWFGGERLTDEPNAGAFHLHWDGASLAAIPSLTDLEPELADPGRSVFELAFFHGQLYESVSVRAEDQPTANEAEPSFLHRVNPVAAQPFEPIATPGLSTGGATPEELEGFRFASDGSSLWALSGAAEETSTAPPVLLSLEGGSFHQVPLTGGVFVAGSHILGFAMEPNADRAWASLMPSSGTGRSEVGPARVARVAADGSVGGEVQLPRPEEELSDKGTAGPLVCPAVGQCWMGTNKGWLFHLGGAPPEGPNDDPAMHQLITSRPCDDACRSEVGVGLPEDNSGAEPEAELFPEVPEYELPPTRSKARPLYNHLKQKVIDQTILQLTFDLHARARVQLIAKEHSKVVAKTSRMTMDKGHHRIRLRLDPKHWPTHLSFQVHRVKAKRASR